jgi:hypothetical protein
MSAFVLGQFLRLEQPGPALLRAPADRRVEETVLTFYDVVNDYLGGGSDSALRRMLHPAFVTRHSEGAWAGTADDFLRHLDSTRQLHPGIRLEAEAASIGDETASVALSVVNAEKREFAGMGIDPAELFGKLEIVRIERGLVVERRSSAPVTGHLDAYPELSIDLPIALNTMIARVQEISLGRASEPIANPLRHLLVIVKSGQARLDVMSQPAAPAEVWRAHQGSIAPAVPIEPGAPVALEPMDAVYLPAGMQFQMWDASNGQTALIALDFGPPVSVDAGYSNPRLGLGPLDGALYSGIELERVGDRLTLSFGSVSVLPRSTLASQLTHGIGLAWITNGSLEVSATSGEARVRKAGGNRMQLIDGHAVLLAGETVAAGPGSTIQFLSNGSEPATAWFFGITPVSWGSVGADPASPAAVPTPARPPNRTVS